MVLIILLLYCCLLIYTIIVCYYEFQNIMLLWFYKYSINRSAMNINGS